MKFIALNNDCHDFEFSIDQKSLTMIWNVSHDLSNVAYIGINSFHLSSVKPFTDGKHLTDGHISIYSNLISRTVTNPKRRILDVRVPKNSSVVECSINTSSVWFSVKFRF